MKKINMPITLEPDTNALKRRAKSCAETTAGKPDRRVSAAAERKGASGACGDVSMPAAKGGAV